MYSAMYTMNIKGIRFNSDLKTYEKNVRVYKDVLVLI